MQHIDIIRRAFRITWTHKWLWLLGFLASLSGGGAGGFFGTGADNTGGNGFIVTTSRGSAFLGLLSATSDAWLRGSTADPEGSLSLPVYTAIVLFVIGVLWLATVVLGEIGHGGLIASIDESERGGRPRFEGGWRAGVARVRTLVSMRLLLSIPGILFALITLSVTMLFFVPDIRTLIYEIRYAGDVIDGAALSPSSGISGMIRGGALLLAIFTIYSLLVNILETFGRRAIMLEQLGAVTGIKRGWELFRSRLRDSIVLAILMAIIRTVLAIFAIFIAVLVAIIVTCIIFGVVAGAGAAGYRMGDAGPGLAIAMLYGIPFLIVLIPILVLFESFITTMNSAAWTLAVRSLTTDDGRRTAAESRESE